jgi:hypothetical protein
VQKVVAVAGVIVAVGRAFTVTVVAELVTEQPLLLVTTTEYEPAVLDV